MRSKTRTYKVQPEPKANSIVCQKMFLGLRSLHSLANPSRPNHFSGSRLQSEYLDHYRLTYKVAKLAHNLTSLIFLFFIFIFSTSYANDNIDFSSPKASFCFSKEVFGKHFPQIQVESTSKSHSFNVSEFERKFYNTATKKVIYPATSSCDGGTAEDCGTCFEAVKSIVEDKIQSFRNSGYTAPVNKRKLVVVGAGPAGLRAAIEAAMMGYKVSLVESRSEFTRGKNIGMFSRELMFLASLGIPESMLTKYLALFADNVIADKVTMPLKIKQTYLWQMAQKLGVTTYLGCDAQANSKVHSGTLTLHTVSDKVCTRHENGDEKQLTDDFYLKFDRLIIANGARSKLRDLVIKSPKITYTELATKMVKQGLVTRELTLEASDSEQEYYNFWINPDASGRGGLDSFVSHLQSGGRVRTDFSVFVGDTDSTLFGKPVPIPNVNPFKMGNNWAILPMKKRVWSDTSNVSSSLVENRWHFEGNFPFSIRVKDQWIDVKKQIILPYLRRKKDRDFMIDYLSRQIFGLFGVDGQVNEEAYRKYWLNECGREKAVENSTTVFAMDEMQTTLTDLEGKQITMAGKLANSDSEYFIVGDAYSDPWYSFGVGQHDATMGVIAIHKALASSTVFNQEAIADILEFEKVMRRRVIQVLLHMYNGGNEDPSVIMTKILGDLYLDSQNRFGK